MSKLSKILFLLAGLSILSFAVIRFLLGVWVPFLWVALGLFAGFLAGAIWIDRAFYKEFLSMKTTKQGMSMGAMIGLVFILLVAINFIGARKYKTFDFSTAKVNTLSDQSLKILSTLQDDLKVLYFYKNGSEGVEQNRRSFIDLIKKYQDQSSKIQLEFVEVNEKPDLAKKYEVTQGTQIVYLDYKGRRSRIEKIEEQELTSAMVKVTREKDKNVYFLSGHGELGLEPMKDGSSISLLKQLLEGSRYTVKQTSLTTSSQIPADADILFVVGPQQSFLDFEVKALEDYLKKGGSMVLALEPKTRHGLDGLLLKLGIVMKNNYVATVLDTPIGKAVDPRFTRASVFSAQHQVTQPFGKDQYTVFRLPSALVKTNVPAGVSIEDLVQTNTSVLGFSTMDFDKAGDQGPFTLGMAVKGRFPGGDEKAPEFNLMVFGDAEFMNEQFLYQNLNRDLVLNAAAFMAKEENLISISPKEIGISKIEITPTQFTLFIFGFIVPLPVLFFVASGVLWYRRRYS
ncbi:MAG: hypothetical protein BroJett040_01990 [Oligoflexia bacterium]|nr:MAG: hypothetical protein BroJett040_01990 [Oligoflexia bacterium]